MSDHVPPGQKKPKLLVVVAFDRGVQASFAAAKAAIVGEKAKEGFGENLEQSLDDKKFLADHIRERPGCPHSLLTIKIAIHSAPENGPLADEELAPIHSDLGRKRRCSRKATAQTMFTIHQSRHEFGGDARHPY